MDDKKSLLSLSGILLVAVSSIAGQGWAQESASTPVNPYKFGGNCQSQGTWTSDATSAMEQVHSVAEVLRKDPNCNKVAAALNDYYQGLKQNTDVAVGNASTAVQMAEVKSQIESLWSYALSAKADQRRMKSELLVNRAMVNATISSGMQSADEQKTNQSGKLGQLLSKGALINKSVHRGLDILSHMLDTALIDEAKCLQNGNMVGPFVSAVISSVSALTGSGQDSFGNKGASLINKLSMYWTNAKYAETFRKLKQAEFRNSMSCLLETITESYCTTLDAEALYREHIRQNIGNFDTKTGKILEGSILGARLTTPLRGFFVLTQLAPVITQWMEKVQRGVEPRNSADSQFKNDILRNTITYYIQENDLFATVNADRVTVSKLPDLISKQRQVLKTILALAAQMNGGRDGAAGGVNFYTQAASPLELPFRLIGMKIPDVVAGKTASGFTQDIQTYLQANIETIDQFKDPEVLLDQVIVNLRELVKKASENAITYYNEWFIYDQASQYVDSVTGFTYNVRDALQHIHKYFDYVSKKIDENPQMDASVKAMLEDTKQRIEKVLVRYEDLNKLGQQFKALPAADKAARETLIEKGLAMHRTLLASVYEEFWVLRARSGFLLGRIAVVVKYDFQNLLRLNPNDTEKLTKEIFIVLGEAAFERMKMMSGSNPYSIISDIKNAQTLHLDNISAVETLLKGNFAQSMAYTNMIAKNLRPDNTAVQRDAWKRAQQDYDAYYPPSSFGAFGFVSYPFRYLRKWSWAWLNQEAYPIHGNNMLVDRGTRVGYDSHSFGIPIKDNILLPEDGAAEKMLAHYCIQSLAFQDSVPFKDMCANIVLQSPFLYYQMTEEEKKAFQKGTLEQRAKLRHAHLSKAAKDLVESQLSITYAGKMRAYITPEVLQALKSTTEITRKEGLKSLARNQSSKICALREFARNNYVIYLTQGLQGK